MVAPPKPSEPAAGTQAAGCFVLIIPASMLLGLAFVCLLMGSCVAQSDEFSRQSYEQRLQQLTPTGIGVVIAVHNGQHPAAILQCERGRLRVSIHVEDLVVAGDAWALQPTAYGIKLDKLIKPAARSAETP